VQATQGEGVAPVAVHINAMVIRGSEPIIVDTGVAGRDYVEDFWSLVDPADVRWVFLSHDDPDHYGNLVEVMEACPEAILVTSWFQWERMGELLPIAPWRMRWVEDGGTFDANGRTYVAARPPAYDSPTTRGLFDTATGVYWGSDCFFTPVPRGAADISELALDDWEMVLPVAARGLSPWIDLVDGGRFSHTIDRIRDLGVTTIASCHSPAFTGANVERAFDLLRKAPDAPDMDLPGQDLLDQIVADALAGAVS
jgi:flavorubredoxin